VSAPAWEGARGPSQLARPSRGMEQAGEAAERSTAAAPRRAESVRSSRSTARRRPARRRTNSLRALLPEARFRPRRAPRRGWGGGTGRARPRSADSLAFAGHPATPAEQGGQLRSGGRRDPARTHAAATTTGRRWPAAWYKIACTARLSTPLDSTARHTIPAQHRGVRLQSIAGPSGIAGVRGGGRPTVRVPASS